jgi:riboflavin synthase
MFSGIIKAVGRIAESIDAGADRRLTIELGGAAPGPVAIGGSIAVNGVCLTAVASAGERIDVDVSAVTLAVTNLGRLVPGARVNLEPPLRLGEPLDGHLVTGHVDAVGTVIAMSPDGRSTRLAIEVPGVVARYVATKGSIAVDGVSLTVNAVDGCRFDVNIIPHTRDATIIGEYRVGSAVNIEVDVIARYLERLGRPADTRS